MKKLFLTLLMLVLGSAVFAQEVTHNPFDPEKHSEETLYKIKDNMMQMSFLWLDLQILSAQEKPDHQAIKATVSTMEKRAQKIKQLNKNPELDGMLINLIGRMKLIRQNNKKKDMVLIRQNLDFMSDTCFKCHEAHAFPEEGNQNE